MLLNELYGMKEMCKVSDRLELVVGLYDLLRPRFTFEGTDDYLRYRRVKYNLHFQRLSNAGHE